jgi:hypothetical protein
MSVHMKRNWKSLLQSNVSSVCLNENEHLKVDLTNEVAYSLISSEQVGAGIVEKSIKHKITALNCCLITNASIAKRQLVVVALALIVSWASYIAVTAEVKNRKA